jgi:hypothetical protein
MRYTCRHAGKYPFSRLLLALAAVLPVLLLPAGPAHGKGSGHGSGRGHGASQSSSGSAVSFGHARDARSAGAASAAHPATRTAPGSPATGRGAFSCRERDERGNCISHAQGASGAPPGRPLSDWAVGSGAQSMP